MDLCERRGAETGLRHPWELARLRFVLDELRADGTLPRARRILDVGSGDAWVASQLLADVSSAELWAWDVGYDDDLLRELAEPRLHPVRERPSGPFDVILLLDVIEHVADDVGLVREVVLEARPGARVLVTVPAWQRLRGAHDAHLRHF